MKGLFPITRRARRPLLPPDEPAQPAVGSVLGSTAGSAVPCGGPPHGTAETDEPSKAWGQPGEDLTGESPASTGELPVPPFTAAKTRKRKSKYAPAQTPTDAA